MRALVLVGLAACRSSAHPADAHVDLDAPARHGAGPGGGLLDELRFAVVGDTRPPALDDTAAYPTDVARAIWTAVAAESPAAQFAVTTGDYMFASTNGSEAGPQLDLYLGARAAYPGIVYATMGNHECASLTTSNCGPGATDGEPPNYTQFLAKLVAPLGETRPYYIERFAAVDGSWSAKAVFVAANAWSAAQASWLDAVLGEPTTYTFVVRHEPAYATAVAGVNASEAIMANHPLTLSLTGHVHDYKHEPAYREIVVGTGGAPLTGAASYGYVMIARQPDASLQVTAYDVATHAAIDRFVVGADGQPR